MEQHSVDTYSEITLWFLLKKLENFQWCFSSLFSINFAAVVKKTKQTAAVRAWQDSAHVCVRRIQSPSQWDTDVLPFLAGARCTAEWRETM